MKLEILIDTVVAPGKFAKAKEVVEVTSEETAALLITKGRAVKVKEDPAAPTPVVPDPAPGADAKKV